MKLLLRRDQKTGLVGKTITFTLDCRAELSSEEADSIKKYKMGKTMLYSESPLVDRGSGVLGAVSRVAHRARTVELTVNDLVDGKHLECKDVMEMMAIEAEIKEASHNLKAILETAAQFGGEEIIEI